MSSVNSYLKKHHYEEDPNEISYNDNAIPEAEEDLEGTGRFATLPSKTPQVMRNKAMAGKAA